MNTRIEALNELEMSNVKGGFWWVLAAVATAYVILAIIFREDM